MGLLFDGASGVSETQNNADLDITVASTGFSVFFIVEDVGLSDICCKIGVVNPVDKGWYFGIAFWWAGVTWLDAYSNVAHAYPQIAGIDCTGGLHYISMSFDPSVGLNGTVYGYADGVAAAPAVLAAQFWAVPNVDTFGISRNIVGGTGRIANSGTLHALAIWQNYVLTQQDHNILYNGGTHALGSVLKIAPQNLVRYYDLRGSYGNGATNVVDRIRNTQLTWDVGTEAYNNAFDCYEGKNRFIDGRLVA